MQNNLTLYANSKEAHFKMLYSAFDIVNNINEKIAKLSSSTGDNNLSCLLYTSPSPRDRG